MKMRRAFTLAEIMVVLAVIGVIVAIITPTIVKLKPNKNKIMFKKAYYVTERVINELINDEGFYSDSDESLPGFVNEGNATLYGVTISGNSKFCKLFASKLNTSKLTATDDIDCTTSALSTPTPGGTGSGNFVTNDGITWHIPITVLPEAAALSTPQTTVFTNPAVTVPLASTAGNKRDVIVDINGTGQVTQSSPNCVYNIATCTNPDQFTITIQYDGKVSVTGAKEIEYLKDSDVR